jgi:signal transduction histidine kinase
MMDAHCAAMRSRAQTWREPGVPADVTAEDILDVLPGFFWRTDRHFRFTYVSEKARDVSGLEDGAYLGSSLEDLGYFWAEGTSPLESRAGFRDQWVTRLEDDGRRIWLSLTAKPVFEASEGFVGYVGTATAGEPPFEAEGGLLTLSNPILAAGTANSAPTGDMSDMFRNAVECLTDGFALFSPDDRLVFCNTSFRRINENAGQEFTSETTFESIVRANMEQGLLGDATGREEAYLAERLARHRDPSSEAWLAHWTNGKVFLVRERKLAEGGIVVVNTDLTELARREKALREALLQAEQANHAKSAFLARMSHELRTPLNAIIGFSDLVLSETFGPLGSDRYRTYVNDVKISGEHLLSLINDLLDLTGIESGRREFVFDAQRPRDLVSLALRAVRPIGRQAGIRLRGTAPATLPRVKVDARSMHQCLLNLLSNAIKATACGGRVTMSVGHGEGDTLVFSVADTGRGMSRRMIARVMTASAPRDQTYVSETEGAGLGLPITKSLIEIMGGRLELVSSKDGGTRASLIVPVA